MKILLSLSSTDVFLDGYARLFSKTVKLNWRKNQIESIRDSALFMLWDEHGHELEGLEEDLSNIVDMFY